MDTATEQHQNNLHRRITDHVPTEAIDDPAASLRAGERVVARFRTLLAVRGVVAVAFAITLLVWPDIGLTALVGAVGVYAITSGFVSAAAAITLPGGAAGRHRSWLTVHAVIGLVVGAVVLLWPGISAVALLYAIAMWAIAVGVIEVVAAFVLPLSGPRTVLAAVGGIALAAIGVVMFAEPGLGAIAVLALVGALALVRGTSDIALAVQLRRVARELDQPLSAPSAAQPVTQG